MDKYNLAGTPYQPSNGTEGMAFIGTYCENCLHEKFMHSQNRDDKMCDILTMTHVLDVKDKDYPKEWIHDKNGQGICTKWQKWDWDNGKDDDKTRPLQKKEEDDLYDRYFNKYGLKS